jgi:hypothetical protein
MQLEGHFGGDSSPTPGNGSDRLAQSWCQALNRIGDDQMLMNLVGW